MSTPYWKVGAAERRSVREGKIAFSQDRRRLKVGLVNNMPDAALVATERQFHALLSAAAPERVVELHLFQVPAVERGPAAVERLRALYRPAMEAERAGLDALIVTGAEPRTRELHGEPFWPALARLADWAADAQTPSLWSCLAAHAAVSHLDGVERRPLARKCSGLFACHAAAPDDPLLLGRPGPGGGSGPARGRTLQARLDAAREDRRPELMSRWPPSSEITLAVDSWRDPAVRLYRNWLRSAASTAPKPSVEQCVGA